MVERKRNRLPEFDYSQGCWYFVTVCLKDMKTYLGKIRHGKMILSKYGKIVQSRIEWLANRYDYVEIDSFVIMPNHFHAIIILDSNVGTSRDLSLQHKIKSLSELVGAAKSTSSKQIHLEGLKSFKWQRSFYDRIIRNERELFRIRKYIQNNPVN